MFSFFEVLLLLAFLVLLAGGFFLLKRKIQTHPLPSRANLDFLIKEIKIYIQNTYPHIVINYAKIENMQSKNQLLAEDILIIEDIVLQFALQKNDITPHFHMTKEQLWSGYEELSVPIKGKLPKDFLKRKELAYKKYQGACARCGQKLQISQAFSYLIKSIEKGGGYRFENIAVVCSDCNKILNTPEEEISKIISGLQIFDYLIQKINRS